MTTTRLLAVGDVVLHDPHGLDLVAPLLQEGDVVFFNCEAPYAESGTPSNVAHGAIHHDPAVLPALAAAGFNVASLANNHVMDWGTDAVVECRERLEALGIAVCGAGRDLQEAHRPAIIERNGTRFGFLAYCCTGPSTVRAEATSPGCATVRAHTAYEPVDYYPGTPRITIVTWPHAGDVAHMQRDIQALARLVDVVVVSFHWGTVYVPAVIPDYEVEVGHLAVEAGADLVLGHSPHILKGMELHRGRVIAHSLNQLVIESWDHVRSSSTSTEFSRDRSALFSNPDSRKTVVLRADVHDGAVTQVSYRPVMLSDTWAAPTAVAAASEEGIEIFDYIGEITEAAGFDTRFSWSGEDVVISATGVAEGLGRRAE